jgi:16S rRNA (cytosine967-C5)-methyltransferase
MPETRISPARGVALGCLEEIFTQGRTLLELSGMLDDSRLSAQDHALAREIVLGTCRWWGRIRFELVTLAPRLHKFPLVQRILELSVYQLMELERVPDYAVISQAVELTRQQRFEGLTRAVNGILRNYIRQKNDFPYPSVKKNPARHLSVLESHPLWLIERWLELWRGEDVKALAQFNNTRAPLSLRVRTSMEQAVQELEQRGIDYTVDERFPNRIVLQSVHDMPELLLSPHWLVQDGGAMFAALLMDPQPEWKVWDVCAAPGGKTFQLADLSKGKARIFATDKSRTRLEKLKIQQEKLGLQQIETQVLDVRAEQVRLGSRLFDAILLDVPCTGWGTFRRHPDLRWRLQPTDSARLGELGLSLLERVQAYLKPGGVLVYSTCTLSPEENERVVQKFLNRYPKYTIESASEFVSPVFASAVDPEGWIRIMPQRWQLDGAFAVRLRG